MSLDHDPLFADDLLGDPFDTPLPVLPAAADAQHDVELLPLADTELVAADDTHLGLIETQLLAVDRSDAELALGFDDPPTITAIEPEPGLDAVSETEPFDGFGLG
ncbi:MAG: hypothetical protein AAGA99_03180 [Actinomycetota bacterium]